MPPDPRAAERAQVEKLVLQAIPGAETQLHDPRGDGRQLVLTVAAPGFAQIDRLAQHRLVRQALIPLGETGETLVLRTVLPNASFPLS